MPETDKEGAKIVIERFRKSVQEMEFEIPGFRITFSAGIATIPEGSPALILSVLEYCYGS